MNSINLQYCDWSPKSTNLILIINNDIYYIDHLNTDQIDNFSIHRLTDDGKALIIYNGISDWIYSSKSVEQKDRFKVNKKVFLMNIFIL